MLSTLALLSGVLGIVFGILFLFMTTGPALLIAAGVVGLLGVVLGIFGVVLERAKAMSVTGIVLGTLVVLFAIGLYLFALVFIGAI